MGLLQDIYGGIKKGVNFSTDMFTGKYARDAFKSATNNTSDRDVYNQQLQGQLGQLQGQMPNLAEMFKQYRTEVMGSIKPQQPLSNNYLLDAYNKSKSNLNYNMNTQVGDAQSSAGAMAASRGLANPSGFTNYAGQNVRDSFIPQFGQLEADQARSLNDLSQTNQMREDEYNRYITQLLASLGQGGINASQMDWGNKTGLFGMQSGMASNYDPYSNLDKTLNVLPSFASLLAGMGGK